MAGEFSFCDNENNWKVTFNSESFFCACVLSKDKPALQTSMLTSAVAFSIAVVYLTLSIPFAAISAALNGTLWLVLVVQKWRTRSH